MIASWQGTPREYLDLTRALIDAEVRRVLEDSHVAALRLLRQHRPELDALAQALLEHETLDELEILNVTGLRPDPHSGIQPLPIPSKGRIV